MERGSELAKTELDLDASVTVRGAGDENHLEAVLGVDEAPPSRL